MVEKEVLRSRRMDTEYRERKPSIGEYTARHSEMNRSLQYSGVRVGDKVSSRTEGSAICQMREEFVCELLVRELAGDPNLAERANIA